MDEKKRIVIVEDRTLVREGLRLLVTADERYCIAGEAEDGHAAIKVARETQPDVILMDLSMPKMNGMEAVREIKKLCPSIKILVLTVHDTDEFIIASLEAGADGYILKDAHKAELMMAIKNVLEGKPFLSPGISEKVISLSGQPREAAEIGAFEEAAQARAPAGEIGGGHPPVVQRDAAGLRFHPGAGDGPGQACRAPR